MLSPISECPGVMRLYATWKTILDGARIDLDEPEGQQTRSHMAMCSWCARLCSQFNLDDRDATSDERTSVLITAMQSVGMPDSVILDELDRRKAEADAEYKKGLAEYDRACLRWKCLLPAGWEFIPYAEADRCDGDTDMLLISEMGRDDYEDLLELPIRRKK